jgi:hypothetical protein
VPPPGAGVASSASPSPWGFWGTLAAGPVWGPASGPISPAWTLTLDVSASFHFVYAGAGFGIITFAGAPGLTNDITGGVTSSSPAEAAGGYLEAGLTKGIFLSYDPRSAVELRPGIGYGYWAMRWPSSVIGNCSSCYTESFAYNGGQYLRLQLGAYWALRPESALIHHVFTWQNGFFMGGTVSFQEFVLGPQPRPQHILTFGLTTGWGP